MPEKVQKIQHDDGKLFRYETVNETGYNIMLNKSTVLFAALISTTLPTIGQGAEKNSPNTQEIQATASPTAGDGNTRITTVPAGLKGHFVVKTKDGVSEGMKDSNLTSINERVVVKSEEGGSGSVKERKTRRFTVPAGLKGHFVIVSEDNGSESMKGNKSEEHQK